MEPFGCLLKMFMLTAELSVKLFVGVLQVLGQLGLNWRWSRTGGTGVVAPGDPPVRAAGTGDYLNYRGVAVESELAGLSGSGARLGRYVHPRGQRGRELVLPAELLHRNAAVIGPPGSGKTEGLVIPWIGELLGAGHSVVTIDVKGDLVDRVLPLAAKVGARFWYWNNGDPKRSQSWNWLSGINDSRDIEAATRSVLGKPKPSGEQAFFYERDYRWLRSLISGVKKTHARTARPRDLYQLLNSQAELQKALRESKEFSESARELADLGQFRAEEYSRAVSGLLNALHLFNTPEVVRVTERNDLHLASLDAKPTLLVVGAALADARSAEVLSSLMLNLLFCQVFRRLEAAGRGSNRSIYFIIDEAARLKDRITYEEVLSVARSAKVGICLAAQDVNQFGDDREQLAILSNCSTFIALSGCSPATAKFLGARLGQRHESMVGSSTQQQPLNLWGSQGTNTQMQVVPVLGEREIMHPPTGPYTAVVQVQPACPKPFLADLTVVPAGAPVPRR